MNDAARAARLSRTVRCPFSGWPGCETFWAIVLPGCPSGLAPGDDADTVPELAAEIAGIEIIDEIEDACWIAAAAASLKDGGLPVRAPIVGEPARDDTSAIAECAFSLLTGADPAKD